MSFFPDHAPQIGHEEVISLGGEDGSVTVRYLGGSKGLPVWGKVNATTKQVEAQVANSVLADTKGAAGGTVTVVDATGGDYTLATGDGAHAVIEMNQGTLTVPAVTGFTEGDIRDVVNTSEANDIGITGAGVTAFLDSTRIPRATTLGGGLNHGYARVRLQVVNGSWVISGDTEADPI